MMIKHYINKFKLKNYLRKLFKSQKSLIELPFLINNILKLKIEPFTYIGPGAIFTTYGNITIKKGTILGPRVKIHTGNHNFIGNQLPYDEKYIIKDVIIEENVWIGSDVIILPGVTIGEGSVIGAGTVVSKTIPKLSIVVGNPARIIKSRDLNHYNQLKAHGKIYLLSKFNK